MQKVSRKKTVSGSLGRGSSDRPLTVDFSHVEARFSCFLRVLQEARAFGLYCCNDKPLLYAKIFSFFFFANLDIYNTFLDEKKVTFFDVARTSLGECCGGKMPQAVLSVGTASTGDFYETGLHQTDLHSFFVVLLWRLLAEF